MKHLFMLGASIVSLLGIIPSGIAATEQAVSDSALQADAKRAKALLERAVAYYEKNNDTAFAAFSRQGEFIDGDDYVYVLGIDGVMLASGGSSAALIGTNVIDFQDAAGKPFFRQMVDAAKATGSGQVEYRWLNRTDNKVERKLAYFRKVKDRIIAVGYYIPRATPEEAKALLERALQALEANPADAIAKFNVLRGPFVQDDLYVFVIDRSDGSFLAHGTMPRLVGTDGKTLTDPAGKPIGQMMLEQAKSKSTAELDYAWRNPVTNKIEKKHTFLRSQGKYLVGVGYYTR